MAKQKRTRAKRTQYSVEDKIKAVTALRSVGREHMLSNAAIEAARAVLGTNIGTSSLTRWVKEYSPLVDKLMPALNPANLDKLSVVSETQTQVIDHFLGIRDKAAKLLNDEKVLTETANKSARDLAVIMGISQDHIAKMTLLPPEAMQAATRLYRVCEQFGESFASLCDDNIEIIRASHRPDNTMINLRATSTNDPGE